MPLCFSYNLQGLGVPVGTPKPFFLNMLLCLKQSGGSLQGVLEGWKLNVSKLTKTGNYGRVTFTMARVNSGRPKKSCSVLRSNPKKYQTKTRTSVFNWQEVCRQKKQRLLKQAGVGSELWPLAARRKGQWKVQRPRLSPMKRPKEKSKDQGKSPISRNSSTHNAKSYTRNLLKAKINGKLIGNCIGIWCRLFLLFLFWSWDFARRFCRRNSFPLWCWYWDNARKIHARSKPMKKQFALHFFLLAQENWSSY